VECFISCGEQIVGLVANQWTSIKDIEMRGIDYE
jgi:hypothetical protein